MRVSKREIVRTILGQYKQMHYMHARLNVTV